MKTISLQLPAALLLAAVTTEAFANGLRVVSHDAFAAARGEAFTATADNPSAIYYNPAGITQLEGDHLRGGLYGIYLNPTFTPPDDRRNAGQTYSSEKNYAVAPDFYFTHALGTFKNFPVTLGLGLYAPYGGSLDWPDAARFRAVAQSSALTYLRFNPVVAVKLCDTLSLAVGASVDYARMKFQQGILKGANPPNSFLFRGDGFSAGYNAGILWQPLEQLSFGATMRGENAFVLSGRTEYVEEGAFPSGSSHAEMALTFPLTATFGVSYRPTPKWNLEFDADYADWSSVGQTTIYQTSPAPPSGIPANVPITLNWQPSWMYSVGVTRYFDNGWHISAGYLFNETSVPDAYYTPLVADVDRHIITVGFGRTGKKFDFDLTYQFGYAPGHTVSGSTPSNPNVAPFAGQNADGTYKFISHAILLSVGMRF